MLDSERLDKLESEVSTLKRLENERQRRHEKEERNRKIAAAVSSLFVIFTLVAVFMTSCDMASLFDGFPGIDSDGIRNPVDEDCYMLVEGSSDAFFGFIPFYARLDGSALTVDNGVNSISFDITSGPYPLRDGSIATISVDEKTITIESSSGENMVFSK